MKKFWLHKTRKIFQLSFHSHPPLSVHCALQTKKMHRKKDFDVMNGKEHARRIKKSIENFFITICLYFRKRKEREILTHFSCSYFFLCVFTIREEEEKGMLLLIIFWHIHDEQLSSLILPLVLLFSCREFL